LKRPKAGSYAAALRQKNKYGKGNDSLNQPKRKQMADNDDIIVSGDAEQSLL